ncbi:hypothetical protein NX059_003484 [Plenodomus lindquistii]|nr:hypothetical protein NX059_003484 [Plenodomus lindquistii]
MGAWGYGLFQSDHDLDMVSDLDHEAGLTKLQDEAQALAKAPGQSEADSDKIYYSIYGNCCSDPELVRAHLDSGILVDMIAKKEAKMMSLPTGSMDEKLEYFVSDPCYKYVLLGACAMSLGCQLPTEYVAMLKKVYTEGGLMPDALRQMKKALFGPGSYENGKPYDFGSKGLMETANAKPDEKQASNGPGFNLMNVPSPGGFFNTGMGNSTSSLILKELRDQLHNAEACGDCGHKPSAGDKDLLLCSCCKNRRYCSVDCQKKHWKVHKKICVA